ncbi:2-hydroxyacid dehydrogenase [Swingsia samuiensis]|uniref:2-hydroxyacid dehydrogenase n=1 Tax=Swingsia samuiensis TaxID=1293412 RepID=A0A4Y6UK98_9PROT|nr:2-hydroxyacid dehydrogenase [Swingsia samuiensis]QDH16811.1 2-hydroxyacid dehydrogenase [Swingsia samuiensis]
MKPEILLLEPMMSEIEKELYDAYVVHPYQSGDDIAKFAPQIRGIATGGGTGVPRAIMDQLPALEIIAVNGVGTDAIDLVETQRRNIAVTTTAGVLTDDVADLALALILASLRDIVAGDEFAHKKLWGKETLPLSRKMSGKKLGIFGMGNIGRAVARRAQGFDMRVSYNSRKDEGLKDVTYVPSLTELARQSDILVISVSGGPATRHLVNQEVLEALGPKGLLVNISRGTVVDEAALIEALKAKKLGWAALDVFENEPHIPDELLGMQNVLVQPHRASATIETRLQMGKLVVDNLAAHFAGKPLLTPVPAK